MMYDIIYMDRKVAERRAHRQTDGQIDRHTDRQTDTGTHEPVFIQPLVLKSSNLLDVCATVLGHDDPR